MLDPAERGGKGRNDDGDAAVRVRRRGAERVAVEEEAGRRGAVSMGEVEGRGYKNPGGADCR